jgi:SPP1 family predicted phage head-tail adaptor
MQAGKFNRKIQIQKPVFTRGATGQDVKGWAPHFDEWAQVHHLRGQEIREAAATDSEVETLFRIRYRKAHGIDTTMRLMLDGVAYNIESCIDVEEAHRFLEISCSTGRNRG